MNDNDKMMNFEEYSNKVLETINDYMDSSEEYNFKLIDHAQFNGSVDKSIVCFKKSDEEYVYSPFFHLKGFYMSYCNLCRLQYPSGQAFNSSMEQLSDKFKELFDNPQNKLNFNSDGINITDYGIVKDKLFLQVCNAEKNKKYLEDKPHYDLDDLSVFACAKIMKDGKSYIFPVYTNYLKLWNVSSETLLEDALKYSNEKHQAVLISPETYDKHELVSIPEDDYTKYKFVVLKNDTFKGASAILNAGEVLDSFAKAYKCDLWVLPASVNEMIIVPKNAFPDYSFYNMTCAFIDYNVQNVDVSDDLSEHIYIYDKDSRCITNPIDKQTVIDYNKPLFPFLEMDKENEKADIGETEETLVSSGKRQSF